VVNNPMNEFVASCVGMDAIVEGVIGRSTGGELVVAVPGGEIDALGEGSTGDRVYCCIRPENVILDVVNPSRTSSARNVFAARIESIASVGPYLKVKLDCGFPLVAHVTRESFTNLRLQEGKRVFASFKATAIHVIRKADGAATRPRGP
jgi:tungstate transport system ATP-binding protein